MMKNVHIQWALGGVTGRHAHSNIPDDRHALSFRNIPDPNSPEPFGKLTMEESDESPMNPENVHPIFTFRLFPQRCS